MHLTTAEIEEWIDSETATETVTKQVRYNWMAGRCAPLRKLDAGNLGRLEREFEDLWRDPDYRRRHCPGKTVLRSVKRLIQEHTKLSLNDVWLFRDYEPDQTLKDLFDTVERHITSSLDSAR